jgi:hypothetical protein
MFGSHERLLRAQLAESNAKLAESNAKLAESNASLAGEHVKLLDALGRLAIEEDRSWKLAERLGEILGDRLKATFPERTKPDHPCRKIPTSACKFTDEETDFSEQHFAEESGSDVVS